MGLNFAQQKDILNPKRGELAIFFTDITKYPDLTLAKASQSTVRRKLDVDDSLPPSQIGRAVKIFTDATAHTSPLEHISATFCIRGTTRIGLDHEVSDPYGRYTSGSHQYQRIINFDFQTPASIRENPQALKIYLELMKYIDQFYTKSVEIIEKGKVIKKGVRKGFARNVTPRLTSINLYKTLDLNNLTKTIPINISHVDEFVRNSALMQLLLSYKYFHEFRDLIFTRLTNNSKIEIPREILDELVEKEFKTTPNFKYPYILASDIEPLERVVREQIQPKIDSYKKNQIIFEESEEPMKIKLENFMDVGEKFKSRRFSQILFLNENIPYVAYAQMIRHRTIDFEKTEDEYGKEAYKYLVPPAIEHTDNFGRSFKETMKKIETTINKLLNMKIPFVDVYGLLPQALLIDFYDRASLDTLHNFLLRRVCKREEWPTQDIGVMKYILAYQVFPDFLVAHGTFPCVESYLNEGKTICPEPLNMYKRTCFIKGPYLSAEFQVMKEISQEIAVEGRNYVTTDDINNLRERALEKVKPRLNKTKEYESIVERSRINRGY